nr:hypothetical protein FEE99_29040 [Pseudomonas sp. ef1]
MIKAGLLLLFIFLIAGCHSNVRDSSPSLLKDGVQIQRDKWGQTTFRETNGDRPPSNSRRA